MKALFIYIRPQIAKFYAVEICEVIAFIHSVGWVYRDLKPENVLLDEEGHIRVSLFFFLLLKKYSIDDVNMYYSW